MSKSIPKPIARKRAKPLSPTGTDRSQFNAEAAPVISIDRKGSGIAEIARQLADLETFDGHMDVAQTASGKAIDAARVAGMCGTDHHSDLCRVHNRFEHARERAYAKIQVLRDLILNMEPANADEALSLAAVFYSKLSYFVSDHCNMQDREVCREFSHIEEALKAIVRGLMRAGAKSPILQHHLHDNDLLTWEVSRAVATQEAGPFRVAYDPAEGRLSMVKRQTEAAS